jgi:hypothetical protein
MQNTKPGALYLHTINGNPAHYVPGKQIIYGRKTIAAAASLRQIRAERAASQRWRKAQGFPNFGARHGTLRVQIYR